MKLGTTEKLLLGGLLAGAAYWYYTKQSDEKKLLQAHTPKGLPGQGFTPSGTSSVPKAITQVSEVASGPTELEGRSSFLLDPGKVDARTSIFVILHGGYATPDKAKEIGQIALTGGFVPNVLKPEGALDQALAMMGRKAQQDGHLVVYLQANEGQQWNMKDMDYVTQAIAELQKRTGARGEVKVSGAAAGLLIAAKAAEVLNKAA